MTRKHLPALAGLAAGLIAALAGQNAALSAALMNLLCAPGLMLRSLSLSGPGGNACAWGVCLLVALLPVVFILAARRKEKRPGDFLFVLTGAAALACLYLSVNPALLKPFSLPEEMIPVLSAAPGVTFLSVLAAAVLTRWSSGLSGPRIIFWLNALIGGIIFFAALSSGFALTQSVSALFTVPGPDPLQDLFGEAVSPAPALTVRLLLTLISLVPVCFLIRTLTAAADLVRALGQDLFTPGTVRAADVLALRARAFLISSACCLAAGNVLQLLTFPLTGSFAVSFVLPLTEMAFAAGTLLLARLLSAALRIRRDNDLMI